MCVSGIMLGAGNTVVKETDMAFSKMLTKEKGLLRLREEWRICLAWRTLIEKR